MAPGAQINLQLHLRRINNRWRLGSEVHRTTRGYWSGMRRVKNSTSSDAAGGSRLLRLTTT
jgi:hypothetical protein